MGNWEHWGHMRAPWTFLEKCFLVLLTFIETDRPEFSPKQQRPVLKRQPDFLAQNNFLCGRIRRRIRPTLSRQQKWNTLSVFQNSKITWSKAINDWALVLSPEIIWVLTLRSLHICVLFYQFRESSFLFLSLSVYKADKVSFACFSRLFWDASLKSVFVSISFVVS